MWRSPASLLTEAALRLMKRAKAGHHFTSRALRCQEHKTLGVAPSLGSRVYYLFFCVCVCGDSRVCFPHLRLSSLSERLLEGVACDGRRTQPRQGPLCVACRHDAQHFVFVRTRSRHATLTPRNGLGRRRRGWLDAQGRIYSTVSLLCLWRCRSPDPRRETCARGDASVLRGGRSTGCARV